MLYKDMQQLIGNTPMVLLSHSGFLENKVCAKLELFNPGGSIKDRVGKYIEGSGILVRGCFAKSLTNPIFC